MPKPDRETEDLQRRPSYKSIDRELPKKGKKAPGWLLDFRQDGVTWRRQWEPRSYEALTFIDGDGQWTEEEKRILRDQERPAYVDNQCHVMIELIDGMERRRRTITKLNPRTLDDVPSVGVLNSLYDYVWDYNLGDEHYFQVADWSRRWGIGLGRVVKNRRRGKEPIKIEVRDPRGILLDPKGKSLDVNEDYEFIGEELTMPLQDAIRRWPFAASKLKSMAEKHQNSREVDRPKQDLYTSQADAEEGLVAIPSMEEWDDDRPGMGAYSAESDELWITILQYRTFEKTFYLVGPGVDNGEEELSFPDDVDEETALDMLSEFLTMEAMAGRNTRLEKDSKIVIRQAIFCGKLVLEDDVAPFGGERYTYLPLWSYRDRHGYPVPVIHHQKDNQRAINKADSKALEHLVSTRLEIDPGAMVTDLDELKEEAAKPNSILPAGVRYQQSLDKVQGFLEYADRKRQRIKENSGLNDELRGLGSKQQSFVALEARQEQGETILARLFGMGELYKRQLAFIVLHAMRAEYTQEKVIRVTEDGKDLFVALNVTDPNRAAELQQKAQAGGFPLKVAGSIENVQADLEITTAPNLGTERDARRDRWLEWMKAVPDPRIAALILARAMENDNLPGAKDIAQDVLAMIGPVTPPGIDPATGQPLPPGAPGPMPPALPPGLPPGEV